MSKEIPEKIDLLHNNFIDDLNDYLYEYLLTGGTPKIVDEKIKTNFISPELYTDYLDGIKGDWGPLRNETLLKQFDFVLYKEDNFEAPMEVKYRNKVDARELGGLTSFLDETGVKSGLVLSKNELEEKQDYLILPTSVFLMLI